MTPDKNDLQRAIDDFNHTLALLGVRDVNQVAELARLKILITKYPGEARQILNDHQASGTATARQGQNGRGVVTGRSAPLGGPPQISLPSPEV